MLDEWSVQTVSTLFNIFKNKENLEAMLNEGILNLIQHTLDKLSIYFFYAFNNVERSVQTQNENLGVTTYISAIIHMAFCFRL